MGIVLHSDQVAALFQVLDDLLAGFVTVQAFIFAAQLIDLAVVIQHPDDLQVVAQTHFKVVGVMGRRHLHTAGAEFHLSIVVGHHGDFLVHQGQNDLLAHDGGIALIVGVDTHAAVAQHGLGTGGGDHHFSAAVGQGITNVPQVTGLIHVFHLGITQGSDTVGAPVDDPAALVNQALFIQGDEHFPNGLGAAFVHGKPGTVPVTAGTQLFLLLHDPVAVLVLPIPHPLQELFPAQVIAGLTLFAQLFFHLDLGGNAGMVNTGKPQCVVALHSLKTNQGVLQGSVHGVTHVQLTRHVGRGHDDGKGFFAFIPLCVEIAAVLPHVVDSRLHGLRLVHFFQFSCHKNLLSTENALTPIGVRAKNSAVPPEFPVSRALESCNGLTRIILPFSDNPLRSDLRHYPICACTNRTFSALEEMPLLPFAVFHVSAILL